MLAGAYKKRAASENAAVRPKLARCVFSSKDPHREHSAPVRGGEPFKRWVKPQTKHVMMRRPIGLLKFGTLVRHKVPAKGSSRCVALRLIF